MEEETRYREARDRSLLVATGKDRLTWLNGLVTCDLAKAVPGDAVYGLAVAKSGRILADLFFLVLPAAVVVAAPKAETEKLRAALDHYLIMEDAELAPSDDAVFFAEGPRAAELVAAARSAGASAAAVEVDGAPGAIFVVARARAEDLVRALDLAGGVPSDDDAWDARRVARGAPRFGVDFDGATYPQEASLEKRAVSFAKGCYLGQEVVCMLEMRGHVKRKLVSLAVDGAAPPPRGAPVTDEAGEAVGEVTSAARAGDTGHSVAIAMVKRAHAEEGRVLSVSGAPARVVRA